RYGSSMTVKRAEHGLVPSVHRFEHRWTGSGTRWYPYCAVLRVVNIVGTRPNLVKMAGVLAAQRARPAVFAPLLAHTQQHHSAAMSGQLFAELELPPPDI